MSAPTCYMCPNAASSWRRLKRQNGEAYTAPICTECEEWHRERDARQTSGPAIIYHVELD